MISRLIFFISRIIICQLIIFGCFTSIPASAALVPDSFSGIVNESTKSVVNISTTQVIKQKAPKFFPFFPDFPFSQDSPDFEGREREFRRQSLGSGFIVDSDGYIITNNHVVENADDITVTLWDESEYKAKVKGRDPKMDIALRRTYDATPTPELVVAVGDCGCNGGVFGETYASLGGIDKVIPVDAYISGCPPTPAALLNGILKAIEGK